MLVRRRRWIDGRITAVKCKLRHKLAHYNADIAGLFSERGTQYLADFKLSAADRFEVRQLQAELQLHQEQLVEVDKELRDTLGYEGLPYTVLQPELDAINAFANAL